MIPFSELLPWGQVLALKVLVPILVLGILVFIHELGHFLFAKMCGVGVLKFAVGFGPAILKFKHKETQYQIGIIPLGGYVRMVGDMPDAITGAQVTDKAVREEPDQESKRDELKQQEQKELDEMAVLNPDLAKVLGDHNYWFVNKSLIQRSLIVFAGPLFNLISAVGFIFAVAVLQGKFDTAPIIGAVMPGSPANLVGLEPGDRVYSVAGQTIQTWEQLPKIVHNGTGEAIQIEVGRKVEAGQVGSGNEQRRIVSITPQSQEVPGEGGVPKRVYMIGVSPQLLSVPPSEAFVASLAHTGFLVKETYSSLWRMISGQGSADELGGPIFILDLAGKEAGKGLADILSLMALLSVSLAVLNLLPIPILDGGHLMFFLLEGLFGPISIKVKEVAQHVGLALLLFVMGYAIKNDLTRAPLPEATGYSWEQDSKQPIAIPK